MKVAVAVALPDRQDVLDVELPEGATVSDALAAAELARRYPGIDFTRCKVGIWSRVAARETVLREGDRVELYRELQADAKQMRRARARARPSPRSRNGP